MSAAWWGKQEASSLASFSSTEFSGISVQNLGVPVLVLFVWEWNIFVAERTCHQYTENKYLSSQKWLKAFKIGFYPLSQTAVEMS